VQKALGEQLRGSQFKGEQDHNPSLRELEEKRNRDFTPSTAEKPPGSSKTSPLILAIL